MIKEREANSWKSVSYAKSITGAQTYTKFPIVLRTTEQSIPTWSVKGNMQQSGTPTPTSPITPQECGERTENLFDYKTMSGNIEGYYLASDGSLVSANVWNVSDYIPCNGEVFTLNPIGGNEPSICLYDADKQFIKGKAYYTGGAHLKTPITITSTTTAKYIRFTYRSPSASNPDDLTAIMLNTGSTAKSYEPYGYKIPISSGGVTTNIYLGSTQTTRKIKKIVFDGSQTIYSCVPTADSQNYCCVFRYADIGMNDIVDFDLAMAGISYPQFITDRFVAKPISQRSLYDDISSGEFGANTMTAKNRYVIFCVSGLTTSEEYTQWFTNNPTTLYYILETPTTGIVNEPIRKIGNYADSITNPVQIPTTSGLNTIDVNTTLKPSEMSLTYDGYKLCKRQRYSRTENLSTQNYVHRGLNWSDGTISDTVMTNRLTTMDFSDITSGQVTAAVYDADSNSYDGVLLEYDSSGNYTGNYQQWHALPYTWTVGSNTKLRICVKRSNNYDIDADNTKIMLNTGSTAKPYQPYLDWE